MNQPKKMPAWLPKLLQAVVKQLVNLQALIGLVMIFCAVAALWRPAGAVLVVGILLALAEIRQALLGRVG